MVCLFIVFLTIAAALCTCSIRGVLSACHPSGSYCPFDNINVCKFIFLCTAVFLLFLWQFFLSLNLCISAHISNKLPVQIFLSPPVVLPSFISRFGLLRYQMDFNSTGLQKKMSSGIPWIRTFVCKNVFYLVVRYCFVRCSIFAK